jgi:hypothetical protein
MTVVGTKQSKRLTVDYVRCTPDSRRMAGDVCFMAVFVCFRMVNGLCGQQAEGSVVDPTEKSAWGRHTETLRY